MSSLEKIHKLIEKKWELEDEIESLRFDVDMRDNYERAQELVPLESKNKRLQQKIVKQMDSYLKLYNSNKL